jgi:hypothetical protein
MGSGRGGGVNKWLLVLAQNRLFFTNDELVLQHIQLNSAAMVGQSGREKIPTPNSLIYCKRSGAANER